MATSMAPSVRPSDIGDSRSLRSVPLCIHSSSVGSESMLCSMCAVLAILADAAREFNMQTAFWTTLAARTALLHCF